MQLTLGNGKEKCGCASGHKVGNVALAIAKQVVFKPPPPPSKELYDKLMRFSPMDWYAYMDNLIVEAEKIDDLVVPMQKPPTKRGTMAKWA